MARLAHDLRELRGKAGLTYREMARVSGRGAGPWGAALMQTSMSGPGPAQTARPGAGQPSVIYNAGSADARYPFDAPSPWLHGYIQEVPPFGGFNAFRPYNYKHVLQQSQISSECGNSPTINLRAPLPGRAPQRNLAEAAVLGLPFHVA